MNKNFFYLTETLMCLTYELMFLLYIQDFIGQEKKEIKDKYLYLFRKKNLINSNLLIKKSTIEKNMLLYNLTLNLIKHHDPNLYLSEIKDLKIFKKYNHYRISSKIKRYFYNLFNKKIYIFIGPDGSGKSSVINAIKQVNYINPKLFYFGPMDKNSPFIIYQTLKIFKYINLKFTKTNIIGIFSRILWNIFCVIDFVIKYLNIIFSKSNIILIDRYPFECYLRDPKFLNRIIYGIFPIFGNFIFLHGDPKSINKRKDDLSTHEISTTIDLYKTYLIKNKIKYTSIDTVRNKLDKTTMISLNLIYKDAGLYE